MKTSGYSTLRVWLHWLSAAVIIWTLVSGFSVASFELLARIKQSVAFINVSLTTVFIPFFVWRLFIFITHVRQTGVSALGLMGKLVFLAHALIYFIVSIVLVTGAMMMDRPINVFGWISIPQPLSDPELIGSFVTLHIGACVVLSLLVVLHVGAVIVHEACGHRLLRRMSWCRYRRGGQLE
ncbi:hypothetical protein PS645_04072 [Pseudomonas fluorescens]|uniref:Cytochrome b561 bacterial/Ni-hydrogenase domain-containing protein n=1 Tax=Pseudomonas fluorescens TaxID=294 RepID=A0A5E6VH50_PSEFL|nr:cytochrome b/b6 domain-containing protein [Pseudomonas fluorescens]VVN16471.1 hypothetical protein PS645_04072 [Pseudomonas fluorescens]